MDHPLFTTTVKACDALLALSHALHLPRGNNLCACWTPTGVRFTTVDSQHRPHDLAQDTNLTAHALLARRTITQAATHALDRLGTCMSQDPILHDVLRNVEGQDQFQLLVNPAFSWPWFGLVLGGNAESRTMRLRIEHKPDALATRLIQAATPAHQGPRKRVVVWPRRWGEASTRSYRASLHTLIHAIELETRDVDDKAYVLRAFPARRTSLPPKPVAQAVMQPVEDAWKAYLALPRPTLQGLAHLSDNPVVSASVQSNGWHDVAARVSNRKITRHGGAGVVFMRDIHAHNRPYASPPEDQLLFQRIHAFQDFLQAASQVAPLLATRDRRHHHIIPHRHLLASQDEQVDDSLMLWGRKHPDPLATVRALAGIPTSQRWWTLEDLDTFVPAPTPEIARLVLNAPGQTVFCVEHTTAR